MINLGLTAAEMRAYRAALTGAHEVRIGVQILDTNHAILRTVDARLVSGQVDMTIPTIDADATGDFEVSRTASLVLFDPSQQTGLDDADPSDNAVYLNRLIRIRYGVFVASLNRWIDVPVFTGPVSGISRDGAELTITASGKEALAGVSWEARTLKGTKSEVITALLTVAGEPARYIDVPSTAAKVAKGATLGRDEKLWIKAWRIARSMGRILYYDGRGVARVKAMPGRPCLTITDGDGGLLLTRPIAELSIGDGFFNAARVTGAKKTKKNGKKTVTLSSRVCATYTLPASHPLSPASLGRNGRGLYLATIIDDDEIKTVSGCLTRAQQEVANSLTDGVTVNCETLPIPDLEPFDIVRVSSANLGPINVRPNAMTLPLTPGDNMTIGALKKMRAPRRR